MQMVLMSLYLYNVNSPVLRLFQGFVHAWQMNWMGKVHMCAIQNLINIAIVKTAPFFVILWCALFSDMFSFSIKF